MGQTFIYFSYIFNHVFKSYSQCYLFSDKHFSVYSDERLQTYSQGNIMYSNHFIYLQFSTSFLYLLTMSVYQMTEGGLVFVSMYTNVECRVAVQGGNVLQALVYVVFVSTYNIISFFSFFSFIPFSTDFNAPICAYTVQCQLDMYNNTQNTEVVKENTNF